MSINLSVINTPAKAALRCCTIIILFCLGGLSACDRPTLAEKNAQPPMRAVHTQLIIPWHEEFARSTKTLAERIERFCQNPANPGEYQEARNAWRASFIAWQPINLLHFGPLLQDNLRLNIYFWPDHFNWVEKHINNRLNQSETNNSDATGPSAALGLAEMEYLLFDTHYTDSAALAGTPCDLLRSASSHIHTTAHALLTHWQQEKLGAWPAQLLTPGSEAEKIALANIAHSLIASFTRISQEELIAPIGSLHSPAAQPLISQAWRANLGKAALLSELKAANTLVHLGLAPLLKNPQQQALQRELKEHLNELSAELTNTPGELVFLINTERGRTQLTHTAEQMHKMTELLTAIAQSLNVPIPQQSSNP